MSAARAWRVPAWRMMRRVAFLVVSVSLLPPCRAGAQTPPAPAQSPPCLDAASQPQITIGNRTLQRSDFKGAVTLGSRVAGDPKPGPRPTERVFCLVPSETAFTTRTLRHGQVLAVSALTELTLLRVEVYRGAALLLASDGAASQHNLLLTADPPWPSTTPPQREPLFIIVSREDAGRGDALFVASIRDEPLTRDSSVEDGADWFVGSLSQGNAFLYSADVPAYESLLAFARCDWVSHDARTTPQPAPAPAAAAAPSTATTNTGCLETQMTALRHQIYPFVSNLTARAHQRELMEGQPRAARSEPMVVFFGLGGANKVLLLDCRDTTGRGEARRCGQFAEPWQTTLQRARYVWAVYIEDGQTPFNTSIDVEFKSKAPSVDYEEYDPRGLAATTVAAESSGASRLLRVGYRRFRVREPPVAVQVAFSRQGANYGLRQWVRVYRQFSARWWVVSGGVFFPAENNAVSHIELEPVPPTENFPVRAQIIEDFPPAPLFATILWRWPQVRGLAENQPKAYARLAVNLIPDVAAGISLPVRRHNSYFVGGSWPILADRLSFIMGVKVFRDEQPADGFVVGQIVPSTTLEQDVRASTGHHADLLFGLAVELVRSR